jgi:6-phosphogluconolactonase
LPLDLPATVVQHLFSDGAQAAAALADHVAAALREGLRHRGAASLLLSGGRTPAPFQEQLSRRELDWAQVTLSLVDDRWVAPDHADSNARLLRNHLLRGAAAAARFIPLVDGGQAPEQHLPAAEQALATMPWPCDALVLGLGEDGHIASLFPRAVGTAEALDTQRPQRLAVVRPQTAPHPRISLTLRALLDTRKLMLLIQGEAKRAALERMVHADPAQYAMGVLLHQPALPLHLYYST